MADKAEVLDACLIDGLDESYLAEVRRRVDRHEESVLSLAMVLMRSRVYAHRREAANILRRLIDFQDASFHMDALYSLALTLYYLDEFEASRTYCAELLRQLPDSTQGWDLHAAVNYKFNRRQHKEEMQKLGFITIGMGLAAAAGIVAIALTGGRKR